VLRIRLLGAFEVRRGTEAVVVPGQRQRLLLAVLALNRGAVVSTARLAGVLWPEDEPADPGRAIAVYVRRLRQALASGPDTGPEDRPVAVTRRPGYLLDLPADRLDLDVFRALLARGEQALSAGRPEEAARTLRQALDLWTGDPLEDIVPPRCDWPEYAELAELHWAALTARIDADLAVGQAEQLLPELRSLVAAKPLRERTRAQLMAALQATGRQVEALETYRDGRSLLVEATGLEPGPDLRRQHAATLAGESPTRGVRTGQSRAVVALREAGEFAGRVGGYQQAVRCWGAALELARDDEPDRADILLRLGEAQYHLAAGGRPALLEARRLFEDAGDGAGIAETEMLLGRVAWLAGQGARARHHIDVALSLASRLEPGPAVASVLATCTGYLAVFGDHDAALDLGEQAVLLAEQVGDTEILSRALINRGVARIQHGDRRGVEDLERSASVRQSSGGWVPAVVHANLFDAASKWGDLRRAARAVHASEQAVQRSGSASERRWATVQGSLLAWWAGRYADAERAVSGLLDEPGDFSAYQQVTCAVLLARVSSRHGRPADADSWSRRAVRLAAETGAEPGIAAGARACRARVCVALGRPAEASSHVRAMLGMAGVLNPLVGSDLAVAALAVGAGAAPFERLADTPWATAGRLLASGAAEDAARVYAEIGSVPDAAAAGEWSAGRPAQLGALQPAREPHDVA